MTLQLAPIKVAAGFVDSNGNPLRDLPFIGPTNTAKPVFRLRPLLDSVGFQLEFIWMQASQLWTIRELLTREGVIITLGIPVTGSGVDLFRVPRTDPNMPAGQLWYVFDDGRTGKPLRDDWRGTATLYYRPSALAVLVEGTDRELL